MKTSLTFAAALVAIGLAGPALADKHGKHDRNNSKHVQAFCPPGLARKSPACIPPGQARKSARHDDHRDDRWRDDRRDDRWRDDDWRDHDDDWRRTHWDRYVRVGDHVDGRWVYVQDPYRYGLDPDYMYYRALDRIFRVDPQTRQVLTFIGLVGSLLN